MQMKTVGLLYVRAFVNKDTVQKDGVHIRFLLRTVVHWFRTLLKGRHISFEGAYISVHCEVAQHITKLVECPMILELIIYKRIILLKMEKIHCISKIQSKQGEKIQAQTTMLISPSPTEE